MTTEVTAVPGMLRSQALARATDILKPYEDHRTHSAAVGTVEGVFNREGFAAAMAKARKIAEAYEEVYLRELLGA